MSIDPSTYRLEQVFLCGGHGFGFRAVGVRDLDLLWAARDREQDQRNAERAASWAARFRALKGT
jgi:hypothetical protein